jgi:hypothetical protein
MWDQRGRHPPIEPHLVQILGRLYFSKTHTIIIRIDKL